MVPERDLELAFLLAMLGSAAGALGVWRAVRDGDRTGGRRLTAADMGALALTGGLASLAVAAVLIAEYGEQADRTSGLLKGVLTVAVVALTGHWGFLQLRRMARGDKPDRDADAAPVTEDRISALLGVEGVDDGGGRDVARAYRPSAITLLGAFAFAVLMAGFLIYGQFGPGRPRGRGPGPGSLFSVFVGYGILAAVAYFTAVIAVKRRRELSAARRRRRPPPMIPPSRR